MLVQELYRNRANELSLGFLGKGQRGKHSDLTWAKEGRSWFTGTVVSLWALSLAVRNGAGEKRFVKEHRSPLPPFK